MRVPAVTLSSLLTERVDLLKLDIEGLETAVLAEAAPRLRRVKRVILEFHGTQRNADNAIETLTRTLRAGRVHPRNPPVRSGRHARRHPGGRPLLADGARRAPQPWQRLRRVIGR